MSWPCLLLLALLHLPASGGIVGALSMALAARRLYTALVLNHRYHFTTWRWGRVVAWMLAVGALLKVLLPS